MTNQSFDSWINSYAPDVPVAFRECAEKAYQQGRIAQYKIRAELNLAGLAPYDNQDRFPLGYQILHKAFEAGYSAEAGLNA